MKIKVKIQLGAYDKKWEDALRLLSEEEESTIINHLDTLGITYKVRAYKLADGTPYLLEYDGEKLI